MIQKIVSCDEKQCVFVTEHFIEFLSGDNEINKFDQVLLDISRIYTDAVLIGAIGASKYIQHPVEPRVTFDVDLILQQKDFDDFVNDTLSEEKQVLMDTYFKVSESMSHSLKHKQTGIYVDFLSPESKPIRKKLVQFIMNNREKATNMLIMGNYRLDILKPEWIIAMKMHRYVKNPRTEKGLSDRLDIVKMLKSFYKQKDILNPENVLELIQKKELRYYKDILADVVFEMEERKFEDHS